MAFRGKGRRFGGGGSEFRNVKQESFVLFPDVKLPEKGTATEEEKKMLQYSRSLSNHFKSSPYFLVDSLSESKDESFDIEKAFDLNKKTTGSSEESLLSYGYILLQAGNFPAELIRGNKEKMKKKKVRWTIKKDLKKLDIWEQLEENVKDKDPTTKKENEEEEEDEEEELEEEEEDSDEGDYAMGEYCDDDEDDYNMNDDGEEEAVM